MDENKKDPITGISPKERHEIVINYLKRIKKKPKVFHMRWKPGDLITGDTMTKTPLFWYMKYGWGRVQIEGMLCEAKVTVSKQLDSSLEQVFGKYDGPRWKGGGEFDEDRPKWKRKKDAAANPMLLDVKKDLKSVGKKEPEPPKKEETNFLNKEKLEKKENTLWNAMSNFGESEWIDYQKFSDNMKERGINISPHIAKALFDHVAGPNGKLDPKGVEDLMKKLDTMQFQDNAQITLDDLSDPFAAFTVMKRVLLAAQAKQPFDVDGFIVQVKMKVNIKSGILLGKLADRDIDWSDRLGAMELIANNVNNPEYSNIYQPDNSQELLCGWAAQILDGKPEIAKRAIDDIPLVFKSVLTKGDPDVAISHVEEIIDNLFKVLDDPNNAKNHRAAKEAIASIVEDVVNSGDPESVLYLAGVLTEKTKLDKTNDPKARQFALEQLQKVLFGPESPYIMDDKKDPKKIPDIVEEHLPKMPDAHREWLNMGVNVAKGPSEKLYFRGKLVKHTPKPHKDIYNMDVGINRPPGDPLLYGNKLADPKPEPLEEEWKDESKQPLKPKNVRSQETNDVTKTPYVPGEDSQEFSRGRVGPIVKLYADERLPYRNQPVMFHTPVRNRNKQDWPPNVGPNDPNCVPPEDFAKDHNPYKPYIDNPKLVDKHKPLKSLPKHIPKDEQKDPNKKSSPYKKGPSGQKSPNKKGPGGQKSPNKKDPTNKKGPKKFGPNSQDDTPTVPGQKNDYTPKNPYGSGPYKNKQDPVDQTDTPRDEDGVEDFPPDYINPLKDDYITKFDWTFGDDTGDTTEVPYTPHAYKEKGPKLVTVTATDKYGLTGSACIDVIVDDPENIALHHGPTIDVGVDNLNPKRNEPVEFDLKQLSGDKKIKEWQIDFGDGTPIYKTTKPDKKVVHKYKAGGTKVATITAIDENEMPATQQVKINVPGEIRGPIIHLHVDDKYPKVKTPSNFFVTALNPNDPKNWPAWYQPLVGTNPNYGKKPKNTKPGEYKPPYEDNPKSNKSPNRKGPNSNKSPNNKGPNSNKSPNNKGPNSNKSPTNKKPGQKGSPEEKSPLQKKGPSNTDPKNPYGNPQHNNPNPEGPDSHDSIVPGFIEPMPEIIEYDFDVGDNTPHHIENVPRTTHPYQRLGPKTCSVIATDINGLQGYAEVQVFPGDDTKVNSKKMGPVVDVETDIPEPKVNQPVTLKAHQLAGNSKVKEYIWDFGDGTPIKKTKKPEIKHRFPTSGVKVAQVTSVDEFGLKGRTQVKIVVDQPDLFGPVVCLHADDKNPKIGQPVNFWVTALDQSDPSNRLPKGGADDPRKKKPTTYKTDRPSSDPKNPHNMNPNKHAPSQGPRGKNPNNSKGPRGNDSPNKNDPYNKNNPNNRGPNKNRSNDPNDPNKSPSNKGKKPKGPGKISSVWPPKDGVSYNKKPNKNNDEPGDEYDDEDPNKQNPNKNPNNKRPGSNKNDPSYGDDDDNNPNSKDPNKKGPKKFGPSGSKSPNKNDPNNKNVPKGNKGPNKRNPDGNKGPNGNDPNDPSNKNGPKGNKSQNKRGPGGNKGPNGNDPYDQDDPNDPSNKNGPKGNKGPNKGGPGGNKGPNGNDPKRNKGPNKRGPGGNKGPNGNGPDDEDHGGPVDYPTKGKKGVGPNPSKGKPQGPNSNDDYLPGFVDGNKVAPKLVKYEFDLGDKSPHHFMRGPDTDHPYKKPGPVTASVLATDINGLTGYAECDIDPDGDPNKPKHMGPIITGVVDKPVVRVKEPATIDVMQLGGSAPIKEYQFNFNDGTPLFKTSKPQAVHAYATTGPKVVDITGIDENGLIGKCQVGLRVVDGQNYEDDDPGRGVPHKNKTHKGKKERGRGKNPKSGPIGSKESGHNPLNPDQKPEEMPPDALSPQEIGDEFRNVLREAISNQILDPNRLNSERGKKMADLLHQLNPEWDKTLDPEARKRYLKYVGPPLKPFIPLKPKAEKSLPGMVKPKKRVHRIEKTFEVNVDGPPLPDI